MQHTGLLLGLAGLLIANVTCFPAFIKKYPSATKWLNYMSAALNTSSGLIAVLVYEAKAAATALVPSSSPGGALRISFVVALLGSVISGAVGFAAVILEKGGVRMLGAIVAAIGILTILRIAIALATTAKPGHGATASETGSLQMRS